MILAPHVRVEARSEREAWSSRSGLYSVRARAETFAIQSFDVESLSDNLSPVYFLERELHDID